MALTSTQRLILYSLGLFYRSINQPLSEKPVKLQTPKFVFIEHVHSTILPKGERALYKNLETLEEKKLIEYNNKMIKFTKAGLEELGKIENELGTFRNVEVYFQHAEKPKRKLQTVIAS